MTQRNPTLDYTICLLRIIACLLIIWNHASCDIFGGWGNGWLWANIGVQIFFFMSGYLYGGREIKGVKPWFLKQFKKIAKPYYLYLAVFFPIIYFLVPSVLTFTNILIELVFLEGFAPDYQIGYIGQHWFLSYILLCYFLTPFVLMKIRISGGVLEENNYCNNNITGCNTSSGNTDKTKNCLPYGICSRIFL